MNKSTVIIGYVVTAVLSFLLASGLGLVYASYKEMIVKQEAIEEKKNLESRLASVEKENRELKENVENLEDQLAVYEEKISQYGEEITQYEETIAKYKERKVKGTIKLGDTKERVKQVMGPPDRIFPIGVGGFWYYGESIITFNPNTGKVDGWKNADGTLLVE